MARATLMTLLLAAQLAAFSGPAGALPAGSAGDLQDKRAVFAAKNVTSAGDLRTGRPENAGYGVGFGVLGPGHYKANGRFSDFSASVQRSLRAYLEERGRGNGVRASNARDVLGKIQRYGEGVYFALKVRVDREAGTAQVTDVTRTIVVEERGPSAPGPRTAAAPRPKPAPATPIDAVVPQEPKPAVAAEAPHAFRDYLPISAPSWVSPVARALREASHLGDSRIEQAARLFVTSRPGLDGNAVYFVTTNLYGEVTRVDVLPDAGIRVVGMVGRSVDGEQTVADLISGGNLTMTFSGAALPSLRMSGAEIGANAEALQILSPTTSQHRAERAVLPPDHMFVVDTQLTPVTAGKIGVYRIAQATAATPAGTAAVEVAAGRDEAAGKPPAFTSLVVHLGDVRTFNVPYLPPGAPIFATMVLPNNQAVPVQAAIIGGENGESRVMVQTPAHEAGAPVAIRFAAGGKNFTTTLQGDQAVTPLDPVPAP